MDHLSLTILLFHQAFKLVGEGRWGGGVDLGPLVWMLPNLSGAMVPLDKELKRRGFPTFLLGC